MEKAILISRGREDLVSASDIQREYHEYIPYGISFKCPLCRQPLFPAAMSYGGKQSPHFRHERNNERAKECELYASNYGYSYAVYQRAPMPMFIRPSRSKIGTFIVEGGFRPLSENVISQMESEGACLYVNQKKYNVTRQRFSGKLVKLRFESVNFRMGDAVRLSGSSKNLNSTWGYPEDASHAMVFSRDIDSNQGKRFKTGDSIPAESDLLLLASNYEEARITESFDDVEQLGEVRSRGGFGNLRVFGVRLSKDSNRWDRSVRYLDECGFDVSDLGATPELIWPPSLISSGELVPLFEETPCVLKISSSSASENRLYVHTSADTSDRVRTIPVQRSANWAYGFAFLRQTGAMSFITAKNWVFSMAVLLHPDSNIWHELVKDDYAVVEIANDVSPVLMLRFLRPATVTLLKARGMAERTKIEEAAERIFQLSRGDSLRVDISLNASLGAIRLLTKNASVEKQLPSERPEGLSRRKRLLLLNGLAGEGKAHPNHDSKRNRDREFAEIRKAGSRR